MKIYHYNLKNWLDYSQDQIKEEFDLKKDEKLDSADTNTKFKAFLGRYFVQDMLQVCYEWGNLQKLKMFHPVL